MRYTLILELPDGRTETKSINSFFIAFHYIKNGLSRIKKNKEILNIIEYVAIDGGYERGASEEETFTFQTNFLFTVAIVF